MRTIRWAPGATLLALAGCAGDEAANNAANVVAEEGVPDLNSAIGGDELSPIPEADDDSAGNQANVGR